MVELNQLSEALQRGDMKEVERLIRESLGAGLSPADILSNGLIAGMDVIGAKFKKNEVFIPEVLIAARAMHGGLAVLEPKLAETGAKPVGKVVLGTVQSDLHDIGKNLVGMMLRGAGFHVRDIGIDVPPQRFVEAAGEEGVQIVAMSALLSTTMPKLRETINALHAAGLTRKVKIMVGGAPVSREYAEEIGADGYGDDAAAAVDVARRFIETSASAAK
ncbi:MAG: cobalamin-binding protein [Candidatus Abyssobacteria bacterium SURF_5]|uniref:Cobalamin-binding protein n=1 Tax=Abyssobacteria bacterium (strain SURF_5) TaxID=2093360 RepID=A0A3A4N092_ABYX5|nr:MAG: cobalamin-binding protein [Candidatus Abyssubacteria bacterium SURF_5]